MSTKMTDANWAVALEVFRASLPRRGDKGRDDRLFLDPQYHLARAAGTVREVEQRVEALRPAEQGWRIRAFL